MPDDKYWNYTGKYKSFNDPIFLQILSESDSKWRFYLKEEFFYNYDEKQLQKAKKQQESKQKKAKYNILIVGVIALLTFLICTQVNQIFHTLYECKNTSVKKIQ